MSWKNTHSLIMAAEGVLTIGDYLLIPIFHPRGDAVRIGEPGQIGEKVQGDKVWPVKLVSSVQNPK